MTTITYGTHTIDTDRFPQVTLDAMLRRGVAHFLGNEVASKVVSQAETQAKLAREAYVKAHGEEAAKAYAEDQAEAWELSADDRALLKARLQEEALQALYNGTVGAGAIRGPRLDPVEAEIARITKAEVTLVLKNNGLKFPKADETVTFPGAKPMDGEALLARWAGGKDAKGLFGKPGEANEPRIRREAERRVAEAAKKAKKAAEAGKGQGPASAEDLGFGE